MKHIKNLIQSHKNNWKRKVLFFAGIIALLFFYNTYPDFTQFLLLIIILLAFWTLNNRPEFKEHPNKILRYLTSRDFFDWVSIVFFAIGCYIFYQMFWGTAFTRY